jgi:AcrR family transcriptional regulator
MRQATDLRRKQIGEVVLEILIDEGPSGVSVQRVAEQIGVVPSALYRHYGSLEEMLEAGLYELKERLIGIYEGARSESSAPLVVLEKMLIGSRRVMPLVVAMPKLLFGKINIQGDLMRFVGCLQDEMLERWTGLFTAAQRDGAIRKDVEPSTLALMYWGMLTHSFLRWVATEGEFDVEPHLKTCWQLFRQILDASNEIAVADAPTILAAGQPDDTGEKMEGR